MSTKMRVGIVGMGIVGFKHADSIINNDVTNCELTSVCVRSQASADKVSAAYGEQVEVFQDYDLFLEQAKIDGIIIATPHYSHPKLGVKAFNKGLAVLMEKPTGVISSDVSTLNKIAEANNSLFSAMFNMRAMPINQKVKEILESGQLGKLTKVHWENSDSYRPQAYYDAGSWRATWSGEGGGVLINQCSHYLDLFQWFFGLPKRVHGFCRFGNYRTIEVEDDVTSYMEFENGLAATFNATTGEPGGTNKLEVIGSKARLLVENGEITISTYEATEEEFNKNNKELFAQQKISTEVITPQQNQRTHQTIIENWANAYLHNEPLLVDGRDGLNSLLITNAIYLSTWKDSGINIPFNDEEFKERLAAKISESEAQCSN